MGGALIRIETTEDGTGRGTRVTDVETGKELRGVARIDISIEPNEPTIAEIEMPFAAVKVTAGTYFTIMDPRTGVPRRINAIVFADGETWVPGPAQPAAKPE